tara:strand:- start:1287 stop:1871 length:585 start_codon:yes stop_codon:yes gene_type:complete
MKAVLIRKSTQEVIKKGKYPNRKMNPIVGLDADLEWLLVVNKPNPSYDPLTHKLVQKADKITDNPHPEYPHLNTYKVSTKAVEMSDAEKEKYIESQEDQDFSAISVDQHKETGVKLFCRVFAKIERKKNNDQINDEQVEEISELVYDAINPLCNGLWKLSKKRIDSLSQPTDGKILNLIEWLKGKIDNYVLKNY